MPDLEKRIADWRAGMLAAGIKERSSLDELESHLREDFEREMRTGANEREAFDRVVERLGSAPALREEFAKVQLSAGERQVHRVLGVGLMATYAVLSVVWLLNTSMPLRERLLGASALALFPLIWSWRYTCRWLPMIPASALGKRVTIWWLSAAFGMLCTVALIQLIPVDASGVIESRYLGVFVWAWLPAVIGFSTIIGLERRRLAKG